MDDKFSQKVSLVEFRQTVSHLNDKIGYLTDTVSLELPAIHNDVKSKMSSLVDRESFLN